MQELLYKSEGAEKSAYPTSEDQAVEHNDSENVIRSGFFACRKCVLQRAERTCARCSRAGIAIKSRGADALERTCIYLSRHKALEICVEKQRGIELDELSF